MKENAGKPHFEPDLGLLDPNLGQKKIRGFSSTKYQTLSQAAILCNIKEN